MEAWAESVDLRLDTVAIPGNEVRVTLTLTLTLTLTRRGASGRRLLAR